MQGIDFVYLNNVKEHLIQNGKEPSFRVWKGINIRDPLDEEWEQFRRPTIQQKHGFDSQVDIRGMVKDVFQQADEPMAL